MECIKKGDKITVEYTGRLEDGTIFDSSKEHEKPLQFVVGAGELIKGFDQAVIGMKIGEEKEITIPPEDAYGPYNPELCRDIPRNSFQEDQEVKEGMMFMMALQDGRQIPVRITAIKEEQVTIDLNAPLAGKTLLFTIRIVDIAC